MSEPRSEEMKNCARFLKSQFGFSFLPLECRLAIDALITSHDTLQAENARLTSEVARLREDENRLWYVSQMMDGIGDVDFHEEAAICMSAFGRSEATREDYIAAVRTAIDAALAKP